MKRILSYLFLLFVVSLPALAQLFVRMEPIKKQFISGEPVQMRLTISNNTGRPIKLQGTDRVSWLDIHLENNDGSVPLPQSRFANFPPLSIPAGKQVSRLINLRHFYDLSRDGSYKAVALVHSPDRRSSYSSSKQLFSIVSGMPIWSQVAMPQGQRPCKYAVLSMTNRQRNHLYIQVRDAETGVPLNATNVGEWLSFFDPVCRVDAHGSLHTLFMATPTIFGYAIVNPNGVRKSLQYYKRISGTLPTLVYFPNGSVRVSGAIQFDPTKPAQQGPKDATVIPD